MSYEDGFCIEYVRKGSKRISCRDCINYIVADRSCVKKPVYLPEIGYDLWKTCKYFKLSKSASFYDQKIERINKSKTGKENKKICFQCHQKEVKESALIVEKYFLNPEQDIVRKTVIKKGILVWGKGINDVGEVIDYSEPTITIKYDNGKTVKYNVYLAIRNGTLRPI